MKPEITKLRCLLSASTVVIGALCVGGYNLTREPVLTDSAYHNGKAEVTMSQGNEQFEFDISCSQFMSVLLIQGNAIRDVGFTRDKICDDGTVTQADETELVQRVASILPRSIF